MEYEREKLLSIGEFSQLLNTTRATLVHYDSLGILKPAYVADNGYRYYRAEQAQTYLIIELFTTCGLGLKELKSYLDTLDESQGRMLVEKSLQLVNEQIRKLNQVKGLMEGKRALYELALDHEDEQPFFIHFDPQSYIRSTIRGMPASQQELQTDHSISICRYVMDHGEFPTYPFASRMSITEVEGGWELSGPSERDRSIEVYEKPSGTYVCMIKRGINHSREEVVRALLEFAREKGYYPIGDLFIIDTVNWVITNNEDEYSTLYQIQIATGGIGERGPEESERA